MPKMKTHKGTAKRMKTTGNKKIKRHKAYSNHRALRKQLKQRKELQKATYVDQSDEKRVRKLLPYQF